MRRLIFIIFSIFLISCNSSIEERAQTFEGKDVDMIKELIYSYAKGDLKKCRSFFTADAFYAHNEWDESIQHPIDDLFEQHKIHHSSINGEIKILNEIIEVVILPDDSKHAHAWLHFESDYKSGGKIKTPVFVSYGINDDGKVYYEWAFFDTSKLPKNTPYVN